MYLGCGVDRHASLGAAGALCLVIVRPLAPLSLVACGGSAARLRAGTSLVSILRTVPLVFVRTWTDCMDTA